MRTIRKRRSKLQKDRSKLRDRDYDEDQFEEAKKEIIEKLRPFYPIKETIVIFGSWTDPDKQAQIWSNDLVDNARQALSWWLLRDTKEQLKDEQKSLRTSLINARAKLEHLSPDLRSLLGPARHGLLSSQVGVSDHPGNHLVTNCLENIRKLVPFVEAADKRISDRPKEKPGGAVPNAASVAMVVAVRPALEGVGILVRATESSDAVKILKVLGDGLGLPKTERAWKDTIIKAKLSR